jgi:hypothetical protein
LFQEAPVPIRAEHLDALNTLYRKKPVAVLDDLRRALDTPSRTTIFRVLSFAGYLTSYSDAGRYYTLKPIPKFDNQGLWLYRGIGFSSHGTLRATVTYLVENSPAGQTHEELEELLQLRVHDTLRLLVNAQALARQRLQQAYVYLSARPQVARVQWAQRQQLAAELAAAVELEPSRVIDVLLDVIRHPENDAGAVASRLRAAGHPVTREQVEVVFARYALKKTAPSRSRRSRR